MEVVRASSSVFLPTSAASIPENATAGIAQLWGHSHLGHYAQTACQGEGGLTVWCCNAYDEETVGEVARRPRSIDSATPTRLPVVHRLIGLGPSTHPSLHMQEQHSPSSSLLPSGFRFDLLVNSEEIATKVVRILAGSIGQDDPFPDMARELTISRKRRLLPTPVSPDITTSESRSIKFSIAGDSVAALSERAHAQRSSSV